MALFDWLTADRPDVREAFDDLQVMLRLGDEMFSAATARLLDNEILEMDLEAVDRGINARETHLREVILDNIGVRGEYEPVDMLKLLGIVHEAERIGDLAKTISQVADLAAKPRFGSEIPDLREIRDRVSAMFVLTRRSFEGGDAVTHAEEVLARHEVLKTHVNQKLRELASSDSLSSNMAVVLALGVRMMGRVSSHLANIASAVVLPYRDLRRTHPSRDGKGDPLE
ncbi:MAG: phosphate uptake regulator [Rhodothermales bacterium]|jgi:phosphate uptake regulator